VRRKLVILGEFVKCAAVLAMVLLTGSPSDGVWPWHHAKANDSATPPATTDATKDPLAKAPDYRIGVNDVLHVAVWKEPELSATVPVRTDGDISIPLLHDVPAAGLTPVELSATISEKLKKYLDDPRVTVVVEQMNHQRIYVVGEVLRHGPMVLLPDMTVLQALATAGLNQFANTKKIYVLRSVNGVDQKYPVNYKKLLKGEGTNQNIALKAGDTIVVP
jgi:polysaccharide export outer membrane protein